jgi:hypothetical protein
VNSRLAPAVLVVMLAAGCASEVAWSKTAGETTCREWTSVMTKSQREGVGAAMLIALRSSDGATVRPPDEMISAYSDAIRDVCASTPEERVSSVGATIYSLSNDLKP